MKDQPEQTRKAVFIGLSGLDVGSEVFHFPRGLILEKAYAHLMSPMLMAFAPPTNNGPHPAPWKAVQGGNGVDITCQLTIPPEAAKKPEDYEKIAATLMLLIRLVCDPSAVMVATSMHPFSLLTETPDNEVRIIPVETQPRWFHLAMSGGGTIEDRMSWVSKNFERCHQLMVGKPEFQLAASAMNAGQFINNSALILVSLMGALESIFSPSKTELKFRVSALIAAYLQPYGDGRRQTQKKIGRLYDRRSAAAHGKPDHVSDDIVQAFELLRAVLIKMIEDGKVPNKDELEENLFGA